MGRGSGVRPLLHPTPSAGLLGVLQPPPLYPGQRRPHGLEGSPKRRQREGCNDFLMGVGGVPFLQGPKEAGPTQDCNSQMSLWRVGPPPTKVPTPAPLLTTQVPGR